MDQTEQSRPEHLSSAKLIATGQLRAATLALIAARDLLYAVQDPRADDIAKAVQLSLLTEQALSDEGGNS